MKKLPVLAVLLAALAATSAPVRAAAPTPQSVEKMLLLAKFGQMSAGLASQVDRAIDATTKQMLQNRPPTPAEKKIVDDLKAKMTTVIDDAVSWDKIKGAYIKIYSDNFTQEQIDRLIAFYDTPTGKAFSEHQPLIEQQIQGLLQPQMVPLTMKVQSLIREAMMNLRIASLPPVPPPLLAKPAPKLPAPTVKPTISVVPNPPAAAAPAPNPPKS